MLNSQNPAAKQGRTSIHGLCPCIVRSARRRPELPKVRAVCVAPLRTRGCAPCAVTRLKLYSEAIIEYRDHFSGRGGINFSYGGKPYSILIHDVACFPQAYAAAATILPQISAAPQALILDWGGLTVDYLRVILKLVKKLEELFIARSASSFYETA